MREYNAKKIQNRTNDYSIIADLIKELYEKDISDNELKERLKKVDKIALIYVCHFLDIDRKWYEKQYDLTKNSYKTYMERHR